MNLTDYATEHLSLTKPQMNLLAKLDAMGVNIPDPTNLVLVSNPTSEYTAALNPLVAALINWVYEVYSTYQFGTMKYGRVKVAIGTFDRVRYLILALDKQAFSDFID
jgi:hypothetical protein